MSKQTALARPIDPELVEVYRQSETRQSYRAEPLPRQSQSRASDSHSASPARERNATDESFEALEEFERIALENQRNSIDRKAFQDGSFDQVEADVSNALKIGWEFLTR